MFVKFLDQDRHDNQDFDCTIQDFLQFDFKGMRKLLDVNSSFRTVLLGAACSPACFQNGGPFDTSCILSGTVVVLGTGTIYAGNVNLDPATWWRMTPSLNVSDGGKWGVLLNMPFGWEKWFRPFGPLGTPKGMDDLV